MCASSATPGPDGRPPPSGRCPCHAAGHRDPPSLLRKTCLRGPSRSRPNEHAPVCRVSSTNSGSTSSAWRWRPPEPGYRTGAGRSGTRPVRVSQGIELLKVRSALLSRASAYRRPWRPGCVHPTDAGHDPRPCIRALNRDRLRSWKCQYSALNGQRPARRCGPSRRSGSPCNGGPCGQVGATAHVGFGAHDAAIGELAHAAGVRVSTHSMRRCRPRVPRIHPRRDAPASNAKLPVTMSPLDVVGVGVLQASPDTASRRQGMRVSPVQYQQEALGRGRRSCVPRSPASAPNRCAHVLASR